MSTCINILALVLLLIHASIKYFLLEDYKTSHLTDADSSDVTNTTQESTTPRHSFHSVTEGKARLAFIKNWQFGLGQVFQFGRGRLGA